VRRHFEQLVHDVTQIEAGRVPFPRYGYGSAPPVAGGGLDDMAATRYTYLVIVNQFCSSELVRQFGT
jgi:hypothetical protein